MDSTTPAKKLLALKAYLNNLNSVAIAFSSGVDSTFLLKVAHDVLGDQVVAVTARSCSFPVRELKEAEEFCRKEGIRHIIVDSEELDIEGFRHNPRNRCEGFRHNPRNRCYLCKHELFTKIIAIAQENHLAYIAEGSNMDDNGDYRPGLKAVAELHVVSPLRYVGLYKEEIRQLSKELGLATWNKQSFACLSSRFVYGEEISREKLAMVDKAEQLLLDMGFTQLRVRIHGTIARIEVGQDEILRLAEPEIRRQVSEALHGLGFSFVTLDIDGYQTGSMNRTLPK